MNDNINNNKDEYKNLNTIPLYVKIMDLKFINEELPIKVSINKILNFMYETYKNKINITLDINNKKITINDNIQNTFNCITINYCNLNDLTKILYIIHSLTLSIKICNTEYKNLNDTINYINLNKYFYDTFINFLHFVKFNVDNHKNYIVGLLKNFYVNAYYDYFFYYNEKLVKLMISNIDKKFICFENFCIFTQKTLKINNKIIFPPFTNIDADIDDLIYYTFDIPNYFKYLDYINALSVIFKFSIDEDNYFNCLSDIFKVNITKQENNCQINKPINNQTNKPNNNQINNNLHNGFVEIYNKNDNNYILYTENV